VISSAIADIAETLSQNYESFGATTWLNQAVEAAIEPDSCFYFQNEARLQGRLTFDLTQNPPPDLVLEIDTTYKSLERFPIYSRLDVSEIWCYDQGQLRIYLLQQNRYVESERGLVFPSLKVQELPELMAENRDSPPATLRERGRLALRRAVREWVRQQQDN